MYYALNENVYLVKGKVRGCIYDLNTSKLYSINNGLSDKIEDVNNGLISTENVSNDLVETFKKFTELGILKLSENSSHNDIIEIKNKDCGCQFAWIEITTKCNLKCVHCYNESEPQCIRSMKLSDYKYIIDLLAEMGIKRVQLIGGEPFVEKNNLKEMLDYTINKFDFIEIFTNGTLITDEWYEYLHKYNINIALSVYSYDKTEHDNVTKSVGSWDKTNNTIQKLKDNHIKYRVCNVLMNCASLGEKNTDLYELNPDKDVVRMSGRANFSLLSDDLIKKRLITKKSFNAPIKREFCSRLVSGHNCFRTKIYISSDLRVYPCVMERRMYHSDIMPNKSTFIELNDKIRNLNKDFIKECSECEYRYACYDCRPNSLTDDFYDKPWFCTYNPKSGKWTDEDEFILELRNKWEK